MITRRGVGLVGVGAALAACGSPASSRAGASPSSDWTSPTAGSATSPAPPSTTTPGTTTPSTTTPSTSTPGTSTPTATPTDPTLPAVRRWEPSAGDLVPAAKLSAVRRVEAAGTNARQVIEVIDAQYGGLLTATASVLVVTRTWTLRNGRIQHGGRTFDVRVSRRSNNWRVTAVRPSRPGPRARPHRPGRAAGAGQRPDRPAAGGASRRRVR